MNLEILSSRAQEIEAAIVNLTNQLNALHGHKTEVVYWLEQLQNPKLEINEADNIPVANDMAPDVV